MVEEAKDASHTQSERSHKFLSPTMQQIMTRQINDIKDRIKTHQILPHRNPNKYNYEDLPNHVDILLFGPAGSGKSSLIRTFYRALHGN